jgi:polysaccharide biosynthesis acetyltransferase WcbI-like protein
MFFIKDKIKVMVLANCQGAAVKALLKHNVKNLEIVPTPPIHQIKGNNTIINDLYSQLVSVDYIITQPLQDKGFGRLRLENLKLGYNDKLISFPVLFFQGDNPELIYLRDERNLHISGFLTDYHDINILVGFKHRVTVKQMTKFFLDKNYLDQSIITTIRKKSLDTLKRREKDLDIKVSDYIGELAKLEKTFWTMNHPKNSVLDEVVRLIMLRMGLTKRYKSVRREFLGNASYPAYEVLRLNDDKIYKIKNVEYTREEMVKMYYDYYSGIESSVIVANINLCRKSMEIGEYMANILMRIEGLNSASM